MILFTYYINKLIIYNITYMSDNKKDKQVTPQKDIKT